MDYLDKDVKIDALARELAKEKADELFYRQKVKELSEAVTDTLKMLPNSLQELRHAIEMLDKESDNRFLKTKDIYEKILSDLKEIKLDLDNLFEKIRIIQSENETIYEKIIDKNNNESMINQLNEIIKKNEELIVDLNNEKSLAKILNDKFNEQKTLLMDMNNEKSLLYLSKKNTMEILNEIKSKNDAKTYITWLLATITAVISILSSFGIISGK